MRSIVVMTNDMIRGTCKEGTVTTTTYTATSSTHRVRYIVIEKTSVGFSLQFFTWEIFPKIRNKSPISVVIDGTFFRRRGFLD